jgi:Ca2+-binding EF-hand superfamily protein
VDSGRVNRRTLKPVVSIEPPTAKEHPVMKFPTMVAVASLAVSGAALANPDDDAKYDAWLSKFKQADLNYSGGLSKSELDKTKPKEFLAIKRRFAAMDGNKDGQVTPLEYAQYLDNQRTNWVNAFNKADANKSAGLSKAELTKTGENQFRRIKKFFDGMDANKDGQVTIAESDSFKPVRANTPVDWRDIFKKADVNDSGGLSKVELDKTSPDVLKDLKKDFAEADTNKDGQVTYAEYQAYLEDDDDDDESPLMSAFKKLLGKN